MHKKIILIFMMMFLIASIYLLTVNVFAGDEENPEIEDNQDYAMTFFGCSTPPNIPDINGPTTCYTDNEYEYVFTTTDPENDDIEYYIRWGDGRTLGWIGPYSSGQIVNILHTWEHEGTYQITTKARDYGGQSTVWSDPLIVTVILLNEPPLTPETPTGPSSGIQFLDYEFSFVTTDPDGHYVYYYVDWGDGSNSEWIGPQSSGHPETCTHSWSETGTYHIKVKAKDKHDEESSWSNTMSIQIQKNNPPNKPERPSGITTPHVDMRYDYETSTTDLENEKIYYYWDLGDGHTTINWLGPFSSGQTCSVCLSWDCELTTYNLRVKAKDGSGLESSWSDVLVINPRCPELHFSPNEIDFGAIPQGEINTKTFEIWNSGDDLLTYTLSTSCEWVSINPISGVSYGEHDRINVTIDTNNLELNSSYTCNLNISSNAGDGALFISVTIGENDPPNIPMKPSGETSGKTGNSYYYISSAIDPNNDQVYLWFDWGDGNNTGWLGPVESGENVTATYNWSYHGSYELRVKARDKHYEESNWSDPLIVSMPKSKPSPSFIEKRFPYLFNLYSSFFNYPQ